MKLNKSMLERLIEVPTKDTQDLRVILDDLGLEVKDIIEEEGETFFNIETLANRGDHLYALGVAREIASRFLLSVKMPPIAAELPDKKPSIVIRRETPFCPTYALLEMLVPEDLRLPGDIGKALPASNVEKHGMVDCLNYIQMEIGQPMHAFDAEKVEGEIVICVSDKEEQVVALDGKTYTVPKESILIKDRKKIIAVAGVIGCENTMVTSRTKRVFIEAAAFEPVHVRKTARAMGISTEASYFFERGCDPEAIPFALKRLVYLCGGGGGAVSGAEGARPLGYLSDSVSGVEERQVTLRMSVLRQQLGQGKLKTLEVVSRFKHLGYQIVGQLDEKQDELVVRVPSWRLWDVFTEPDLIEDFARAQGLGCVKLELPKLDYQLPNEDPIQALFIKFEPMLLGNGFCEVITQSLYSKDQVAFLEGLYEGHTPKHVTIINSVERKYSHLKVTNVLSLGSLIVQNQKQGVESSKVFELSRFYSGESKTSGYEHERDVLTLAAAGRWFDNEWLKPPSRDAMLKSLLGVVQSLSKTLGLEFSIKSGSHSLLHPGAQGVVLFAGKEVGSVGVLHPAVAKYLDAKSDVVYGEIELDTLLELTTTKSAEMHWPSDFPRVRRDLTLLLPTRALAGDVLHLIQGLKLNDLAAVSIVDDFQRANETMRRVTYRLTFQSSEKTLEAGEVDDYLNKVLETSKSKLGIHLADGS